MTLPEQVYVRCRGCLQPRQRHADGQPYPHQMFGYARGRLRSWTCPGAPAEVRR